MKKTLTLVFVLTFSLLLGACGGKTDCAQKIKDAFSTPFSYSVNTAQFGFDYSKTPEKAEMLLTSPDTLKSLTVTRTAQGVTASYDDIVVTLPENTVNKLVTLDILADKVAGAIDSGEYTLNTENGVTALTFVSGDDTFTVTCGEDGTLAGARINAQGKTYEFTFLQ